MKKIVFIVNPHSGVGKYKNIAPLIETYLDKTKFSYTICYTKYKKHAIELTQHAITNCVDIVVAVGGDGTINEVASTLIHTDIALAMIPVGSGNGLARHLHIPINATKAIEVLNQEFSQYIDTLIVNKKFCVSITGIGFDALVAKKFDKSMQKRGFFAYFRFIINSYFFYKQHSYVIETPEKTIHCKALLIDIANSSQWGFNVKISPKASLQDGKADICIVKKPRLGTLFAHIFMLLIGRLHKDTIIASISQTSQCSLYEQNFNWQYCHIDGEPIERQQRIDMQVVPNSLKVIIPTKF